jgi:hypothetical protein
MKKIIPILLVIISAASFAQNFKSTFLRQTDLSTGFVIQTWSAEEERISEFTVPVTFILPVSKDLTITANTNSAFSTLTSAENNLFGLSDSRISGSYVGMNNHLLVTAGIALPTGQTRLEEDQNLIASALALYPLEFRVPSYGQGLSLAASGVYAFDMNTFILGGGIGFVYKNGFKPFKSSDIIYKPGSEFSINIGGETKSRNRNAVKLTADITYTMYGSDTFDDKEVLKSGSKILVNLRALMKAGNNDLMFYATERTKGKNDKGFGTLITEAVNSNGNQIDLGGMAFFPYSSNFGFKGALDLKLYSKNGYDVNGATIFGIGGGFNWSASQSINLDILAKYSTGSLNNKSLSTPVTGIELSGGIKIIL